MRQTERGATTLTSDLTSSPYPWTKEDVRQYLGGVSIPTIDRMMRSRGLPYVKYGQTKAAVVRFNPDEVRAWVERHHRGGAA
jgi:predicted DNA-binding transcriptional regulator AlpA